MQYYVTPDLGGVKRNECVDAGVSIWDGFLLKNVVEFL